jgi:hypothetical protein
MPDSTVIQEFLAELGFKVDQKTLGDFTKALKSNATQAVAFGNIWSDVAESVGKDAAKMVKGVLALTSQLDQLYFAGRRLQDTAQNISALSYVYKQMGLAPEKGQAFGEYLEQKKALMQPVAFAQWANSVAPGAGVLPSDKPEVASRKMMDALARGAHGTPAEQSRTAALLQASGLPITFGDVSQWDPSKSKQFWDQSIKSQKDFGANLDQTTKDANATSTAMRELGEDVRNLKIGALDPFLGLMTQGVQVGVQFANSLSGVARGIEGIARSWADATAKGVPQNLILPSAIGTGISQAAASFAGWGGFAGFGGAAGAGGGAKPPAPTHHGAGAGSPTPPPPPTHPHDAPTHAAPPPQPPPSGAAPPRLGRGKGETAAYKLYWAHRVEAALIASGKWTAQQARGIAMGVLGEGGTPTAIGPKGYGALGIEQLLGTRKAGYLKKYGAGGTTEEKFGHMIEYLNTLDQTDPGWASVRAAVTAAQAQHAYVYNVMRPDKKGEGHVQAEGDIRRGLVYLSSLGGGPTIGSQTNNFNIRATDPPGTMREINRHLNARHTRPRAVA